MVPKTHSFLFLAMMICLNFSAFSSDNNPAEAVNNLRPSLRFNFENCVAYGGGSSADYSEFTAHSVENPECSRLSVFGDNLFRLNPNRNSHSCAPGMNGTTAMCISANEYCTYFPGHEQSLRVNVLVTPGPDGVGSLNNISFFSKAPDMFQFIDGQSGINNYPTKLAIRILNENGEIYRNADMPTTRDWSYRSFDLSEVNEATVTTTTLFRIEILPYCLVGAESNVQAWDIEDLIISGGCNSVNGGTITTNSNTNPCSINGQSTSVSSTVSNAKGESFSYLVVDSQERIVGVYSSGNIGFSNLPNGPLRIYHLAYEGNISGLSSGQFLFDLVGCYDLSNAITVNNSVISGGNLFGPNQSTTFTICPNSSSNFLTTSLQGASGSNVTYVLTNTSGQILATYPSGSVDFTSLGVGNYNFQAVSSSGSVGGLANGSNLSALSGCYAVSSAVSISKSNATLEGGTISAFGQSSMTFCESMTSVNVSLSGNSGSNRNFIITNPQGRIISIQSGSDVQIGGINENNFSIWNISYESGLSGLEIDGLVSNLGGCFDLSNTVTVTRDEVSAGSISVNGSDLTILCLKNNDNQAVTVDATGQSGDNIVYVITDENGTILEVTNLDNQSSIDFDNVAPGICQIWALAYNNNITGLSAGNNVSSLGGDCYDLSTPVQVIRNEVESGQIEGPVNYEVCVNSGNTTLDLTVSGNAGNFSTWLVTDAAGNVLETSSDGSLDFGNAPAGVCFVYHLSHSDETILYGTSENINDIVLGCFELSSPVEVVRKAPEGGTLTLDNGATSVTLLLGQGASASVSTILTNEIGDSSIYLIYDDTGTILEIQNSNLFNFDGAVPGICFIINVSYCGPLAGLTAGNRIDMLEGCYSVSNRVEVTRENSTTSDTLNAGIITTPGGLMETSVCIGNSDSDEVQVIFQQNPIGSAQSFVVTDELGEILEIDTTSTIDFSTAPSGICNIYHLVYNPATFSGLTLGNNLTNFIGDFDLSNAIVVTRNIVSGGTLLTTDSMTVVNIVVGDGLVDEIDFITSGFVGDTSMIILTDEQGVITGIPTLPLQFDNEPAGVCLAWNISYTSGLQGLSIGTAVPNLGGCYALSNPVRINKEQFTNPGTTAGGVLTSMDSLTSVNVCLGGMNSTIDVLLSGAIGDTLRYVITDAVGEILVVDPTFPFDFNAAGTGVCNVYNVSYNGMISGFTTGMQIDSLSGDYELSNALQVTREIVNGGTITDLSGQTTISIVVGDGLIDSINVALTGAVGDNMSWIVTDTLGNIQELPAGSPFTFENSGPGVCRIWNLSYTNGLTGLTIDNNVNQLEGCFSLSNPIEVIKTAEVSTLSGGSIMTTDSLTTANVCLGTANVTVDVLLDGAAGDTMRYLATNMNGLILGVFNNPTLQFSGLTPGNCEIYHISYNGTIAGLEPNMELDSLAGNFDLSNPILVIRDGVVGGSLMTTDSMTSVSIVVGDGIIDSIDVILSSAVGDTMSWVVTDTLGNILELPSGPPFTFENAGAGVCQLWSLSYANGLTGLAVNNNVSALEGCFALSNNIEIIRTVPMVTLNGGNLMTTDSMTVANICLGTSNVSVDMLLDGAVGDTMRFVATNSSGIIIAIFNNPTIQFSGAPSGNCQINHISWNGTLTGLETNMELDSLSGNFDLSNPISVIRDEVDGGSLMTSDSMTAVSIVVGDGIIDSIDVILAGTVGDSVAWVVTDTLGNIVELPSGPPFTFENAGAGVCQLWSLSYATGLTGLAVNNNVSALDGCFALSNNIEITRTVLMSSVSGGTIMTTDSLTSVDLCLGTVNELVDIILDSPVGDTLKYVITDTFGIITEVVDTMPYSFNGFSDGVCEIHHLAYNGTVVGLVAGEDLDTLAGNFGLSNTVTVSKNEVNGGLVQFSSGSNMFSQTIIVGDGMPDTLNVAISSSVGDSMAWVVSSPSGVIQDLSMGPQFIFDDSAVPGTCRISNISYSTGLTGLAVNNNINIDLQGCFDNSNFLVLTKQLAVNDSLIAGTIATADSMTVIDICVGDNGEDVDLLLANANGPNMSWAVTNTSGTITAISATEPINFPAGLTQTCEISHIVYDSTITGFVVGEDIDTLGGNFLQSNIVTVNKFQLGATSIQLSDGTTMASITTADGMTDTLTVVSSGITADTSLYILVSDLGIVTTIQDSSIFLFDNQAAGVCFIYEISYNIGFTGLVGGADINDLTGCFALSNPITVTKTSTVGINGGVITTPNGNDVQVCITNAVADSIVVSLANVAGDSTAWVITDTFGIVLDLPLGPPFAFDSFSAGACQIWHMSYDSTLTGLAVNMNVNNLGGTFDFSNSINVDKNEAGAGFILTTAGMNFDTIVLGSTPVDSLFVNLQGSLLGENMSWIVTDTLGNINTVNATPPFTFEGSGAGQCNVYHMSYADGLGGLQIGANINMDLNGCYDLSDSIRVVKISSSSNLVSAGSISASDGTTSIEVCRGNMVIDTADIVVVGANAPTYNFVIANSNGFIFFVDSTLQTILDTMRVQVETTSPAPLLNLHLVASQGSVGNLGMGGSLDPAANTYLTGIFDISNPIALNSSTINPGTIDQDSLTIIVGDGIIDTVNVTTSGLLQASVTNWVVYDSQGVIQSVNAGPPFFFENSGAGIFYIDRIASTFGISGVTVGSNIADIAGCFATAGPYVITTIQATLAGGNLQTVDSTTLVNYCFNSTYTLDSVDVILSDTLGGNYAWLVTDTAGVILDLPLGPPFLTDSMDPSTCSIWNLSYEGTLSGLTVGENVDTLMGTFLLSNPIVINKSLVHGGTLSTPGGQTVFDFCVGDGDPDVINFMLADTLGGNYQYVITDTLGNIILVPSPGATFQDFEGFGDGICDVFNLSSADEILGLTPGMNIDSLSGCYEISNNLRVNKNGVDGNIILSMSTPGAIDNMVTFCTSDGALDSLTLSTNSTMGSYQYVITDMNDAIDSVLVGNVIDFEGSGFGTCRVYGVSYTGNFIGTVGDTVGVDNLSSECEDITDLPLIVTKEDCSMPIITEVVGNGQIELNNAGTAAINLDSFFLCGANFTYAQIHTLSVVCGSTVLQPGDYLVVDLTGSAITVDPMDGEMALYRSAAFGNSSEMLHYTEWGSSPHNRTSVAVIAGIWSNNQFAVGFSPTTALKYDGLGFSDTDWSEGSPTPCAANIGGTGTSSRLTYTTYPNPAIGNFKVFIPEMPTEDGTLLIYDSYGKIIETKTVHPGILYEIDLTEYGSGMYYTKLISGREGVVKKMMIVK